MTGSGKTLKALVVGGGHVGHQHLACVQSMATAELVGVCDLSPATAAAGAERWGGVAWSTDYRRMLGDLRPDVVHVATPVTSHFRLAKQALESGAHVILEKPATVRPDELEQILRLAEASGSHLVEDHNYVFNRPIQEFLALIAEGSFGQVTHVDVSLCLDIVASGSAFVDAAAPHPSSVLPGGAIADFATHLASLAHAFIGEHRSVSTMWLKGAGTTPLPYEEFRALVAGDRATAAISFSARTQPDTFRVRLDGTRARAETNLFEPGRVIARLREGPRPLMPVLNGLSASRDSGRTAIGGLIRKLSGGPGVYEGLWELLERSYRAFLTDSEPPVSHADVRAVNRLVADLTKDTEQV